MSGLYIHIPFCLKKCNYCNFHFSTRLEFKTRLIESLGKELELRKNEAENKPVKTVYLGGGTPSILSENELDFIFNEISENYDISQTAEVTLEANPDNLTPEYLAYLKKKTPVNRLSIGIQSFSDEDLLLMNRAHSSQQAENCIKQAQDTGFDNITIDLIYGAPTTTDEIWISNLEKAISLDIPHISSYALTVEPKTVFESQIRKGVLPPLDEEKQLQHFTLLRKTLIENGYIHYELSNFGKPGFLSQHNTSYWKNKSYIGVGPSAHSFDGKNKRSWNIANNMKYIQALEQNQLPFQEEIISEKDSYNEYVMLGLRTMWGITSLYIDQNYPEKIVSYFHEELEKLKKEKLLIETEKIITVNPEYLFQTDGIISQLFFID